MKTHIYTLDGRMTYGDFKGVTIREVMEQNPDYFNSQIAERNAIIHLFDALNLPINEKYGGGYYDGSFYDLKGKVILEAYSPEIIYPDEGPVFWDEKRKDLKQILFDFFMINDLFKEVFDVDYEFTPAALYEIHLTIMKKFVAEKQDYLMQVYQGFYKGYKSYWNI